MAVVMVVMVVMIRDEDKSEDEGKWGHIKDRLGWGRSREGQAVDNGMSRLNRD